MRLPSAFVVLTVAALSATACSIPVAPSPRPEPAVAALKDLGVEGKTYVSDLGAERPFQVLRVHTFGDDVMLEDIAGGLLFLDGKSLNPRWAYYGMKRPFDVAPDATDTIVTGVSQGRLYVLSRRNGLEEIAPAPVSVVPSAGAVSNDATFYIPTYRTPSGNKTVQSVSIGSGYQGWGYRTSDDVVVSLKKGGLHGGDMIYAAAADGMVHGFPAFVATERNAEPAWSLDLRSGIHQELAVSGDYLGVVTDDHRLVCVDRIGGSIRWETYPGSGEKATGGAQFSSKHCFYVIAGEMRAFDRDTGAAAWSVKGATRFVAERGERTLLTDGAGTLMAVETKSGKVIAKKSMPGWTFPTRESPDATVVAVSRTGMLVGVELGW